MQLRYSEDGALLTGRNLITLFGSLSMKYLKHVIIVVAFAAVSSAAIGAAAVLNTPHGLALGPAGDLVVSCQGGSNAVVIMSRGGEKLAEFGADRLVNPAGLAVDGKGRIIVANSGKNEIAIFDAQGKFLAAGTGLANPQAVAVGPDGLIYVADSGNNRIAVFGESAAKILFTVEKVEAGGAERLANPTGVTISPKGGLAISDTGNRRILLMSRPTKAAEVYKADSLAPYGMEPGSLVIGKDRSIYVIDRRAVRGYSRDGKMLGSYTAKTTLWFEPGTLAMDAKGSILVTDRTSGRVFVTHSKFFDVAPELKLDRNDPRTATVEWTSQLPQATIMKYGTTELCDREFKDGGPTRKHRAVLTGLKPATRYYYHIYAPVEAIPPTTRKRTDCALKIQNQSWNIMADGYSGEYAFATMPEKGKTDWASAPTVVLVYRRVTFSPGADGKKPDDRVLDDNDMATLKSEMETYRLWAWRHSSCKLNFDWTYVIVDEPRDAGQLGDITETVFKDIKNGVEAQGKDLRNYWYVEVIGVHGWYANYLAGTVAGTDYELGSCYTGFGHGTKPGWWWFPTHEHGHLLHSWLMCSGVGTFAFPDAPWTLPGQFGENFSFLAYNYRHQPVRAWLTLKKSVICQSVDANDNGVPDDDPRVPLDEKRFGWTKEMGGDCLKRLMAGGRTPGYTGGTDTDFEGKVHKLNEGELYWIDRKVPKTTVTLDGKIEPDEWREFYSLPNIGTPKDQRDLKAKMFLAWDDRNYYFAIKSSKQVIAGFDLDAANDGWFHGRDNLRFSVRPPMDGRQLEVSGSIWDFLNDTIQPNGQLWYTEAYKPGDIKAAVGEQDGWYIIECAVPARPDVRIAPKLSAKFGFRAYLWTETEQGASPQIGFWDGEDFVYDITCAGK